MAFTAVLLFGLSPALLDTGVKMPPASLWRAYKRRNVRGEYRDIAAHDGRPGGHKKSPPRVVPERALAIFKIFSPSPR